jgi:LPXTG-motif cell wall-anchored protein
MFKKILSLVMVAMLMCMVAIPAAFAAGNVSFTLNCSKPDYTFTVYKVADYAQSDSNAYGTQYNSLVSDVSNAILAGDMTSSTATSTLLAALDASSLEGAETVGTYDSTTDGATKTFSNKDKGIYYVKATNYPAGVQSVTNSVFALPYYDASTKSWVNTIPAIDLAAKTTEDTVTLKKTITNSTQNNENYTDGSLGDTVNFKLKADTAGSDEMTLNSYVITDTMSAGLTFDKSSVAIELQKENGTRVKTLANTEYTVTSTGGNGSATNITFTLTPATALASGSDFYDADYVVVTYSADINKYAVTGKPGNPNTANSVTYTNKNDVSSSADGNTVYVYTYTVNINKMDQSGSKLQGAKFSIYDSTGTTLIGSGVSNEQGLVTFTNTNGDAIKLAPGSYIVRETEAPTGYNRYAEDITVTINPTYTSTFTNGSYVSNTATDGIYTADVKNSKTLLPATGGAGELWIYIVSAMVLAAAAGAFVISRRKARASK